MKNLTIRCTLLVVTLLFGPYLQADDPAPEDPRVRATAAIRDYLERRVQRLHQHEPANVSTLEQWQAARPMLRRQLFDMLGLSPLPQRTDLKATVTGQIEHEGVIVERLHFQSMPGLYVTANFYRHREASGAEPTILYLNGHGKVVIDGVSYGNKVHYESHPLWFAKNGYKCLTIDTLQLGEIEGDHHGTYKLGQWWWIARGYTPAGVEAWNSMRALDYLETRSDVDMKRIGVTGRSGGGAYTWWLAALDDRPACIVPVAGITDLEDHVVHDCVQGHCDCMYHINRQGWDFATIACLAAPRPCLLANSDKDNIFPLGGVTRIHDKLRQTYGLYGAGDKLGLFISEGPHSDTQELQVAAFRWMNRWLKQTQHPILAVAERYFAPAELKVFDKLPDDQRNTTIQNSFVPAAEFGAPPASLVAWDAMRSKLLADLRERSFGGIAQVGGLDARILADRTVGGRRMRVVEFASDEGLEFPLFLVTAAGDAPITRIIVEVADDGAWKKWSSQQREFAGDLKSFGVVSAAEVVGGNAGESIPTGEARVLIAPRGWGPNAWLDDPKNQTHIPRRFVLTGTTVDEGRIFDVRRAIATTRELLGPEATVELVGRGPAAGIALYAAVFEPAVSALKLSELSDTHRDGPILIDVLRVLDVPQALALVFPRKVTLSTADPGGWTWSVDVAKLYGESPPLLVESVASEAK